MSKDFATVVSDYLDGWLPWSQLERMEACHSIDVGFDRFRTLLARCRAAVSAEVEALMVASRLECHGDAARTERYNE
jgi:hypothetical protein